MERAGRNWWPLLMVASVASVGLDVIPSVHSLTGLVHSLGGLPVVASVSYARRDGERPLLVASVGRVFHILL